MSEFLNEEELEFLVNLPENEFNKYIDIPNGDESDIGDEGEDDTTIEQQTCLAQSEAVVMNLVEVMEGQQGLHEILEDQMEIRRSIDVNSHSETHVSESVTNEASSSSLQQSKKKTCRSSDYKFKKTDFVSPDTEWLGSIPPPPKDEMTPFEYYKAFLDDSVFELIAEQSNIYALQKDGILLQTNKNELEQFVGILLHMGIVKIPSIHLYWSAECRYPPVADVMSRNRFFQLLRYFHIANNQERPVANDRDQDKLFKVRPLLNALKSSLQSVPPEEYIAVDEQIIPFKGRSSLKQYVKNKPHKWGYKCFTSAGASGIMYDFQIYVGKNTCSERGLGFSGDIVLTLTDTLPEKQQFKVFADNWFSSISLAVALKERGILYAGTVRADRMGKCPLKSEAQLKTSGRGSLDWRVETTNNIALVRWFDRKSINFLSSYTCLQPIGTCRRYSAAEKKFIDVPRPEIVAKYNKHMGGVDLADMLIELYRINLRSRKWYMRIIFWCLSVAVTNGWLLYRRHSNQRKEIPKLSLLQFQTHIAAGLTTAGKQPLQKKRGRPSVERVPVNPKRSGKISMAPIIDVRTDGLHHVPDMVPKKGRCKVCIKSTTQIVCTKCKVNLCLTVSKKCFHLFHEK